MNSGKLKAKDLITTAIFTVIFVIVTFACVMTLGTTVIGYIFLTSATGLLCGIVWLYMRLKVQRRFTIIIQSVVCGLLFFFIGAGPYIAAGIIVGGIVAELITGIGKYKNFKLIVTGYAAYNFCFHWGIFLLALLARDYYVEFAVNNGTDAAHMDTLMQWINWPMILAGAAAAVVFAVVGILIGKLLLKKHFLKAGMI
ncbi:MAG: MptD family putative ECF transporter S component [Oscillospiraceae bacterium]|jgi:energy-coupling factor transport system substrate-specific component|nr:MptD family putative ECF transporter S component [Oscillospiraceae bacterium]